MTFLPKNLRDHLPWLQSSTVQRFTAQRRLDAPPSPASGGVTAYLRTEAAGDLVTAGMSPRRRRLGAASTVVGAPAARSRRGDEVTVAFRSGASGYGPLLRGPWRTRPTYRCMFRGTRDVTPAIVEKEQG